jgi:hypothetical protein
MLKKIKRLIYKILYNALDKRRKCVLKAAEEQNLSKLMNSLETIIDDNEIVKQYTNISPDAFAHPYWKAKLRAQHSFQISMVMKAIELFNFKDKEITIVDIGDSAGTHILYLKSLLKNVRSLSVNLDKTAVEKIQNKGLEAVCCRAEELEKYNVKPDMFISFQTLEHLLSPIHFMKSISDKSECKYFVITIPYKKNSRVAIGNYINDSMTVKNAEGVHIFELCPDDWKQIFKFSGWKISYEQIYTQYPKTGIFSLTKNAWKENDFEGFYGVVLEKDDTYKKLYMDWD